MHAFESSFDAVPVNDDTMRNHMSIDDTVPLFGGSRNFTMPNATPSHDSGIKTDPVPDTMPIWCSCAVRTLRCRRHLYARAEHLADKLEQYLTN